MFTSLNRVVTMICLVVLLVACNGSGSVNTSFYEPFSSLNRTRWTGLWLTSASKPTAAPIQVTSGSVDIPRSGATFYDWSYSASNRERDDLTPSFFVYGNGGHLFGISLSQPGSPVQLSNGRYTLLCYLEAAQSGPYGSKASFVVAQVSLTSGATFCDTTWILPTNSDSRSVPAAISGQMQLLGGIKDTSTGLVTGFLFSTGTEIDLYSASSMTKVSTLLTGLAGNLIVPLARLGSMSDAQAVAVEAPDDGIHPASSSVYLMDSNSANLVGTYPQGPCSIVGEFANISGTVINSSLLYAVPNSTGLSYTVFSVPLSGGAPTAIYNSTASCATEVVGSTAGRLVVEQSTIGGLDENISLDPTGPASQAPISLSSVDDTHSANVNYLLGGNAWFEDMALDPVTHELTDVTTSVIDVVSGHTLKTYAHSLLGGDFWKGINADGSVARGLMLIDKGTINAGCNDLVLNSIEAVDPVSFASDIVSTSSAPCMSGTTIFGFAPLAIGRLGSSMYALSNPSGSRIQLSKINLTAPSGGSFVEIFGLSPY